MGVGLGSGQGSGLGDRARLRARLRVPPNLGVVEQEDGGGLVDAGLLVELLEIFPEEL